MRNFSQLGSATRPSGYSLIFAAVLVGYFILSIIFFLATPLQEASDEARHVGFVLFLKERGHLPDAFRDDVSLVRQEATQAPLYYVIGALLVSPFDTSDSSRFFLERKESPIGRADLPGTRYMFEVPEDRAHTNTARAIAVLRGFSILLGALTLFLIWRILELVGDLDRVTTLFILSLVAFNPMWQFITSSVNNDNLVVLLTATAVYAFCRLFEKNWTVGGVLILGMLSGFALLAKQSATVIAPAFLIALFWFRGCNRRSTLLGALYLAAIGLSSGWWFVRNFLLYGELLAMRVHMSLAFNGRPAFDPFALLKEWDGFLKSFWGVFGAFNIIFYDWIYQVFFGVTFFLLGAILISLARKREFLSDPRLVFCLLLISWNLIAVALWTSRLFGSQGRLMFPSLAALAAILAILSQGYRFRGRAWILTGISLFLIGTSLWASLRLIPSSYF